LNNADEVASTPTILPVKFLDLENISARLNLIKIELIPPSKRGKLWSWDMCQGVEVEPAYSFNDCSQRSQGYGRLYHLKKGHDSCVEEMN
jgi:hypothetical protein